MISSHVIKGKELGLNYQSYFEWKEPVYKAPSHRFLAMMCGEEEGFLRVGIQPEKEKAIRALEEIFDTFSPGIYRYAYRLLGDSELARECMSETFSRFLTALKRNGGPDNYLQAYLYRIAHNWITDFYRQKIPQPLPIESVNLSDVKDEPHQIVADGMSAKQVRNALALLTPDQRQVSVGEDSTIGQGVTLNQNVAVGSDVSIGDATTLNQGASVGDGTEIGNNVVIGQNVYIGENVTIGEATTIGQGAVICSGADVGSSVIVGKNVLIQTSSVVPDGSDYKAQKTAPSPSSCSAPP